MNRTLFFSCLFSLFLIALPSFAQQAEPTQEQQEMIKQQIALEKQNLIKHYIKAARELDQYALRFWDSVRYSVSITTQLTLLNVVLKLALSPKEQYGTLYHILLDNWRGKALVGLNTALLLREIGAMVGARSAMSQLNEGMQAIASQINQLDSYLQFSPKNTAPKNNVMAA